ncbi:MAG: DUF4105 domain-containing protein [Myxococcota bacterium]
MRLFERALLALLLAVAAWGSAALWIDGPAPGAFATSAAVAFATVVIALLGWVRPLRRTLMALALADALVLAWWLSLSPRNDRIWEPSVARPPVAHIEGDLVTIENVRNFEYRSEEDFTEIWETRRFDLSKLRGADFFFSYWGSPWIAHTIVSWDFEDGPPLAISIETRKESHESYSALLGFFRQYELYYVVADERDVIGVRTNHRGEDVYLYRLKTPPEAARAVLLDYLEEINRLAERPRWYNALTQNCTTTIRTHVQHVAARNPWNWRILVNGRLDELGYLRGTIDTSLPFEELRRRSYIVEEAQAAGSDPDFSRRIRAGLPGAR